MHKCEKNPLSRQKQTSWQEKDGHNTDEVVKAIPKLKHNCEEPVLVQQTGQTSPEESHIIFNKFPDYKENAPVDTLHKSIHVP